MELDVGLSIEVITRSRGSSRGPLVAAPIKNPGIPVAHLRFQKYALLSSLP